MVISDIPYDLIASGASINFRAMYEGSLASSNRPRLDTFSYQLQQQSFAQMSQEEISLISSPEVANPQTCTAFIKFLENTWRAQGDEAAILRADMVTMLLQ